VPESLPLPMKRPVALESTGVPDPDQLLRRSLMVHVITEETSALRKTSKHEFTHVCVTEKIVIEIVNIVVRNNCNQYCC